MNRLPPWWVDVAVLLAGLAFVAGVLCWIGSLR